MDEINAAIGPVELRPIRYFRMPLQFLVSEIITINIVRSLRKAFSRDIQYPNFSTFGFFSCLQINHTLALTWSSPPATFSTRDFFIFDWKIDIILDVIRDIKYQRSSHFYDFATFKPTYSRDIYFNCRKSHGYLMSRKSRFVSHDRYEKSRALKVVDT